MPPSPLAVVMPVYNEAAVIRGVVADVVAQVLEAVPGASLVLVDDRGTDGTSAILTELEAADPRISVLANEQNLGHGPSVRHGLDATTSEWVLLLDSDGQVDATDFARLWEARTRADLVLAIRADRQDPAHRLVSSRAANALVTVLVARRVRDANAGFKLVRRTLWNHLRAGIPPDTFAPSIPLVMGALRSGARVVEVPVTHRARPAGPSTLDLRRLAGALGRSAVQAVAHRTRRVTPFTDG